MVAVRVGEMPEFLRHSEAVVQILRRHEVLGTLDTTVQVTHLQNTNDMLISSFICICSLDTVTLAGKQNNKLRPNKKKCFVSGQRTRH